MEIVRIADAIEAAHGGDDDHVPSPAHEGAGGADPKLVYFVIDTEVFLYIGIRDGNIGFRLVIVVIGYEVFYGVVGEEGLEFPVQLGGQRLVVAEDEGRALEALNDVGHGESLPGAGDAQQGYGRYALAQRLAELVDGFGLVAGRLIGRLELEIHKSLQRYSILNK